MNATHYICPVCSKKMTRDLEVFLTHTNAHVLAAIKEKHPDWLSGLSADKKRPEFLVPLLVSA